MWSTEILILSCLLSFVLGELTVLWIIALLTANKEDKSNADKQ